MNALLTQPCRGADEGSVLSMDALTPHQLQKMQECLAAQYVHLQAPAGAGKTFVALNRLLELLEKEKEVRRRATHRA